MKALFTGNKEELRNNLWSLDLGPIMFKAIDKEEGEGWSEEEVFLIAEEYRRFLFLSVTSPIGVVPTKAVDKFWHYHILDTMKYAEDTERIFGFFLHHFPYLGMRGEEDKLALDNAFQETAMLYQAEFGSPYSASVGSNCQPSCSATGTCNAVSGNVASNCQPSCSATGTCNAISDDINHLNMVRPTVLLPSSSVM